jgi:Nif-specific regulatory protein
LVRHFVKKHAGGNATISQNAYDRLLAHDWPGNVRQLENTIRSALAVKSAAEIGTADLPTSLRVRSSAMLNCRAPEGILPLAEVEKRHILRALEYTNGDITAAAGMLEIGKTTLYRKLKEYNSPHSKRPWQSPQDGQRYLF